MSSFDQDLVRKMAELAKLKLTDDEVTRFASQLDQVFDYMKVLDEVDLKDPKTGKDVPETAQVTGLEMIAEEDVVKTATSTPEELLESTELPVDSKQIKVKKVV